jgi:diacylglycerol kinase family enzyme
LHETASEGHAEEITRYLTKQIEPITILVIGGDGTLNEVLNGIVNFEIVTIGLIPLGSGNDFAAATKIPLNNPIEAAKFALTTSSKKINFINANK